MDPHWTNPALSLQPYAYSMHSGAAEPGDPNFSHVTNVTLIGNPIYGSVNNTYGHNTNESNISYDGNPNVASPTFVNPSVVNPSVVNPNDSDLDYSSNDFVDNSYVGNTNISHGVAPGYDERNKTPLHGRVGATIASPNTVYGGNSYIENSYPGNLNNAYGYNPYDTNIIYDNTNVASPIVVSSSVLNLIVAKPNISNLNDVGNSFVDNMYAGNADVGSIYSSHEAFPGYDEYNKSHLAAGALIHDVPLGRGRVDATIASANTTYGGNRYINNSNLGDLNSYYGHNRYPSNIVYENTSVASPSFGSPSVVNPNVSNPNAVGNTFVDNTYVANTYVGNKNVSHGVSHRHDEYNKTPLATGAFNHHVPFGRFRVDATINSGATGLVDPPTLASNTNISDMKPLRVATNHNGQATSSIPDKNRFLCLHEGCFQDFGRIGDLERHWKMHQLPEFECPFAGCRRKGAQGFARKDHRNNHSKICKFQPRS